MQDTLTHPDADRACKKTNAPTAASERSTPMGGESETTEDDQTSKRDRWAPRMWMGCNFPGWCRLLARNRFSVGWGYLYFASVDTVTSAMNSLLSCVQAAIYASQVAVVGERWRPYFQRYGYRHVSRRTIMATAFPPPRQRETNPWRASWRCMA